MGTVFKAETARRVLVQTRRAEGQKRREVMRALGSRLAWGAKLAVVGSSSITKATTTQFGLGSAVLQVLLSTGKWSPMQGSSATVTIMNPNTSSSINAGALVIVITVDGQRVIDWVQCGQTGS